MLSVTCRTSNMGAAHWVRVGRKETFVCVETICVSCMLGLLSQTDDFFLPVWEMGVYRMITFVFL